MKKRNFDLIIIGGGPAGTPVAMEYALLNPDKTILLVDNKGKLGGECLFDGCIPSKILEVIGNELNENKKLQSFGINSSYIEFDWDKIKQRKENILSKRTEAAAKKLSSFSNVKLLEGVASFVDKNTIKVVKSDKNVEEFKFKKAVIGTGSSPFIPDFGGNGLKKAWTNVTLFDEMILPESLTIIGDGPIGIELSQIFSSLGVEINLIGNKEVILPMIEKKFSDIILHKLKQDKNINLILNSEVKNINFENDKFSIEFLDKNLDEVKNILSKKVLIATGRSSNIDGLSLSNADIKFKKKGIVVNKYLQTTNRDVYACGDVCLNYPKFAHTASYGAHIITQNLFFQKNKFKVNFNKNSWVLFSNPNFASAGISEHEARELGIDIIIGEYDFSIDAKAQIENEAEGFLKFIVDKKTLKILGINILHSDANSIAGEAALIVSNQNTLLDIINSIHPHPTLSESFSFLAKNMMANVMKERMKNPMFKLGFFIKKWFIRGK